MSCESGGVKVDHACSVPNSGPIVTSFGFENRPLRLSSLECGLADRTQTLTMVLLDSPKHQASIPANAAGAPSSTGRLSASDGIVCDHKRHPENDL
jgi:hypothetical protein